MTQSIMIPLPHLTVLELTGPDAQAFLQAQVPSDLRLLTSDRSQISGWCTAKGRLLTTFVIWPVEEGYRLILASDVADSIAKRLKMYVLRLKVQISRPEDSVYGLLNPTAALGDLSLPAEAWQVTHGNHLTAIRLNSSQVLLTGNADALATLASTVPAGTPEAWLRADIAQGFPLVTAATSEHYVPQMVNLDKLGGVSFKKGCYPGQEIVARTHYLGKIKRHLYRVHAAQAITMGAEVRSTVLNDQACGSILCAAPIEAGDGWQALAVLQQDAASGDLYILSGDARLALTLVDEVMPQPEADKAS